jgi:hypothetical protein
MLNISSLIGWCAGGILATCTTIFAVRKLWQLLRPIRVEAGVKMIFDKSGPDEIKAKILNRSRETQYVVRCVVRCAYPLKTILRKHLKNLFIPPRLYPTIWFSTLSFEMLSSKRIKLEPFEQTELAYRLSSNPLQLFPTPVLQVEVELSTHRIFRSSRMPLPDRWRFKGGV